VSGRSRCHIVGLGTNTVSVLPKVDSDEFRSVMSHFCSGLTIITAMTEDGPVGFTCQSFTSLSLDPPFVLFCPSHTSTTWPRIRAVGRFCVNVLAAHHEDLSTSFAKSGVDKFRGVEFDLSPNGSPLLQRTAAWVDCSVHAEHEGGDHVIVVGAVESLAANHASTPLLFHRGRYAHVS
jgi:3-hydroxy-9,10-secoandrosta-1,3,5(10)-triene-9,17-dione monooxygenase reductase component